MSSDGCPRGELGSCSWAEMTDREEKKSSTGGFFQHNVLHIHTSPLCSSSRPCLPLTTSNLRVPPPCSRDVPTISVWPSSPNHLTPSAPLKSSTLILLPSPLILLIIPSPSSSRSTCLLVSLHLPLTRSPSLPLDLLQLLHLSFSPPPPRSTRRGADGFFLAEAKLNASYFHLSRSSLHLLPGRSQCHLQTSESVEIPV